MTRLIRAAGLVLGILGTGQVLGQILGPLAGPALAQQSKMQAKEDRVMGCALTFTGAIETGDAAVFAAAVADQSIDSQLGVIGQFGTRICLDSPGGVLAESVKIARIIHNRFGTAVPSGATCESACAVVFMAGSREPEGDPRGGVTDRVLHPLGRLGFHAPALDVADGQYNKAAVTFAFNAAVGAIGDLVSVAGQMDFPETLLTRMLSTPSQEMYHITTIADAARWGIAVAPTVLPERMERLAVFNACTNHYRYLSDFRGQAAFNENDDHTVSVGFPPEIGLRNDLVEATLDGFGQERALTCSVSEWPGEAPASPWGWVSIGLDDSGDAYELYAFQFFTRSTRIATLALVDDTRPATEFAEVVNAPWENRIDGHCFRFQANRMVEDQACVVMSTAIASSDLEALHEGHEITLASGERVAIFRSFDQWTINDRETKLEFDASFDPAAQQMFETFGKALGGQGWFVNCFALPDDGTRLCFLGHAAEGGEAHFAPWGSSIRIFN